MFIQIRATPSKSRPLEFVQRYQLERLLRIGEQAHIRDQQIRKIDFACLHVGQHFLGGIDQWLFGTAWQPLLAFEMVTSFAGDGAQPINAAGMLVGKFASAWRRSARPL